MLTFLHHCFLQPAAPAPMQSKFWQMSDSHVSILWPPRAGQCYRKNREAVYVLANHRKVTEANIKAAKIQVSSANVELCRTAFLRRWASVRTDHLAVWFCCYRLDPEVFPHIGMHCPSSRVPHMISYSDDSDIAIFPPAVPVVLRCGHLGAVPLVNGMVLLHAPCSMVARQAPLPRRACLRCVQAENHFL